MQIDINNLIHHLTFDFTRESKPMIGFRNCSACDDLHITPSLFDL